MTKSEVEVSAAVSCLLFSSHSQQPKIRSRFLFATDTPTVAYCRSTNKDMPDAAVVAKLGAGDLKMDDNDDGLH